MKRVLGSDPVVWQRKGEPKLLAKAHGLSLQQKTFVHPVTGQDEIFTEFTKKDGLTCFCLTETGNVLMIQEFCQSANRIVWKFPATTATQDESMFETMSREIIEETGYVPEHVRTTSALAVMARLLIAPRKSPSGFRTFVATGCKPTGQQKLDDIEAHIAVYEMSVEEMWDLFDNGQIVTVETVMAAYNAARFGYIKWPPAVEA